MSVESSLRQFCRLLMADRLFGDELTRIALQASEGSALSTTERRVAAFRRLLDVWREAAASHENQAFTDITLLQGVGAPPSAMQVAVLLSDVLGFPHNEIERILAPTDNSVMELVVSGRVMFASKAKGSVIVIEDEAVIASDLRLIIEDIGGKVKGTAANAKKGLALAIRHRPDAMLVDYNLEGSETGVDLVREVRKAHDCAVIFVTAFPDEVLKGIEDEPDVVIAKPYTEESIRAAVAQTLMTQRPRIIDEQ